MTSLGVRFKDIKNRIMSGARKRITDNYSKHPDAGKYDLAPNGEKHIFLIRHGQTEPNKTHTYCGYTDVPLAEEGKDELRPYREYYEKAIPVNAKYFTSGMKRANQTMEILCTRNGKAPEFNVDKGFMEMNFGEFEMHHHKELMHDPRYVKWLFGDFESHVAPGGESGLQMEERVLKAFERLIKLPDENLVVVIHGGSIFHIMKMLFPEENRNIWEWEPKNGKGYILDYSSADGKWTYENILEDASDEPKKNPFEE